VKSIWFELGILVHLRARSAARLAFNWKAMFVWFLFSALGSAVLGPITFEEIAGRAGVHFTTNSSPTPLRHQPETMPGGVALFDYDGDGYLDIYFVNGAEMPSLVKRGRQFRNRLYRNNGNLTFTDVTEKSGLGGAGYGIGVAVGDYDNDGRPDLFVTTVKGNQLFHNNGDGTFTDVTAKAGVGGDLYKGKRMWSVAAAWLDYNNDGLLDLFVSDYCRWNPDTEQACFANGQNGARIICDPRYCDPLPNALYRNNGDGTFTNVSAQTGIAAHLGRGMGVAVADYDGDGYADIFVANDNAANQLFHNIHGERFEEVALDAGVALGEDGNVLSGMGADFRDVRNTGLADIWMTAIEKQTFPFFGNGRRFPGCAEHRARRYLDDGDRKADVPLFLESGQGTIHRQDSRGGTGDGYLRDVRLGERYRGFGQRWLEGPVCGARERRRKCASIFTANVRGTKCGVSQSSKRQIRERQRYGRA